MSTGDEKNQATLFVKNVGGISETELTFSPGVTILSGRNATNRTSSLQAIMAACGSDRASIKGDADEAHVELTIGNDTYSRTLTRNGNDIQFQGEPYLDDAVAADLFAFLLKSNEARQAVVRNDDLRPIIMRPVDTHEIRAEIDRLLEERQQLETQIDEIDSLKGELPELEAKRSNLRDQLQEKQSELADKEAELEAIDADLEESRKEKDELEGTLERLQEKRSILEDVRYDLETERESRKGLRAEMNQIEDELGDLPDTPVGEIEEIDSELDRLRTKKRTLEAEITEIQSTIRFNEDVLSDTEQDIFGALGEPQSDDDALTDRLLGEDTVTCWTCGSTVQRAEIETTVDQLQELSQQKVSAVNELGEEITDLEDRRNELQGKQRERDQLERRLQTIDEQIDDSEQRIDELQARREELTAEVERIDETVESMDNDAYSEVLDLHKEANQLEYELGRLESDLDRVEDNIATIEARLDEREDLETEREAIKLEIEELRTKIERIETEAIEAFNDHMETVLELLDYDNLARIWLERVEREVREGRRKVTKSLFELHIVRQTESGTAYEDTIEHLSESEREVTGLVFALAGYLVHDVHEQCPFMLLDSLEAIDAQRIATLVGHFEEYCPFLVIALLPEDAEHLDGYERITEI